MPLLLTLIVVLTGSYEEISIDDAKAAALAMFPPEEESKQGAEESAAAGMQRRGSGGWERVEEMDLGAWEVTSHMRVLLYGLGLSLCHALKISRWKSSSGSWAVYKGLVLLLVLTALLIRRPRNRGAVKVRGQPHAALPHRAIRFATFDVGALSHRN